MTQHSVLIENVSKKFGLSLRSALKYGLVDSFRRAVGKGKDTTLRKGEFWALQDVNVSLEPGDALGIMGVNGSGKTTLLRILNGTYSPDAGRVTLRGRVGALIAAGAGFSPMLSGRENVFISGTLLGMTPAEIRKKFDEIVAFADLENFIDMPVRNYSSGMSVRLGFAVAVLGTPEILLVDEVLAVGDIAFQKKCYERILSLRNSGTTILLVSHSMGAIWTVCNKGIMLHHGNVTYSGTVEEACRLYDEQNFQILHERQKRTNEEQEIPNEYGGRKGGTGEIICTSVKFYKFSGKETEQFEFGESITIKFFYIVKNIIKNPIFRSSLDSFHQKFFMSIDSYEQGISIESISPGEYILTVHIDHIDLRPGSYTLNNSVVTKESGIHLYFHLGSAHFIVAHPRNTFLFSGNNSVYFKKASMELKKC